MRCASLSICILRVRRDDRISVYVLAKFFRKVNANVVSIEEIYQDTSESICDKIKRIIYRAKYKYEYLIIIPVDRIENTEILKELEEVSYQYDE